MPVHVFQCAGGCGADLYNAGAVPFLEYCGDCMPGHACIDCGLPIDEKAGKYGCCGNGWKVMTGNAWRRARK